MIPGLFRTLVGLVLAWMVFRFLDRMFGRRRSASSQRKSGPGFNPSGARSKGSSSKGSKPKDDDLGEYVEFEEVVGDD